MLKSGSNHIRKLFHGRSRRKIRTDSYWTDIYPSPEHSWLRKTANTTGDWIYNNIDNFFQGPANKYKADFNGDLSNPTILRTSYKEWELNQGIADIAFKDIKSSLSWILPGFVRKFAFRLQQLSLLYLFTDVVNEEESSERAGLRDYHNDHSILDKGKILYTLQGFTDRIDSNCLSINNWWKQFISRLRVFLRLEQDKKTYYLLGYFAPLGLDYSIDNQNYMIRGPDQSKLNPAFSFHKRI